jgi:hypothetical protein
MVRLRENHPFRYCLVLIALSLNGLTLLASDARPKSLASGNPERKKEFAALIKQIDDFYTQQAAATAAIDWKSANPDVSATTRIGGEDTIRNFKHV